MNTSSKTEQLDSFLSAADRFSVRRMVCDTPHGKFMVDTRDKVIGRSILLSGEFEFDEKRGWFDFLPEKKDGQIIDIGANIGTTAIPLAFHGFVEQVHAVEPDPDNFSLLEYNIAANNLGTRVHARQYAISNHCGTARFELSDENYGDHRIRYQDLPGGSYGEMRRKTIDVACITLDEMVARNGIDLGKIRAIKSDTQGSEGFVLEGAQTTLKAKIPWIIEFWPYGIARSGFDRNRFYEIVAGFFTRFVEFKTGAPVRERPVREFSRLFDEYPSTSFCNLMLVP